MKPRKPKLNLAQRSRVQDWWRALQPRAEGDAPLPGDLYHLGRGDRARLRRCADAQELLTNAATLQLANRLIALDEDGYVLRDQARSYEQLAWVAGVLAYVKEDLRDDRSLAWHLGHGAGNARPLMGDLRFRTLQRCANLPDLFVHWRRAVQLADGKVDAVRLADDLLSWQLELGQSARQAGTGVKFHWAYDYYLSARDASAAALFDPSDTTASTKEISA